MDRLMTERVCTTSPDAPYQPMLARLWMSLHCRICSPKMWRGVAMSKEKAGRGLGFPAVPEGLRAIG
jgi:hypothetical protein